MSSLERVLAALTIAGVVFSAGAVMACDECRILLLSQCKEIILPFVPSPAPQPR